MTEDRAHQRGQREPIPVEEKRGQIEPDKAVRPQIQPEPEPDQSDE